MVDGHCLDATEHRIEELRERSASLPNKALSVLDAELGLISDVVPCEDGHVQERRLTEQVLRHGQKDNVWIAYRNIAILS